MKKPRNFNIRLQDFLTEDQFWAIRNLEQGTATKEQQKSAIKALAENVAGLYQISYDEENNSNTILNEGKRWVGRFIYEVITAPHTYFKSLKPTQKTQPQ